MPEFQTIVTPKKATTMALFSAEALTKAAIRLMDRGALILYDKNGMGHDCQVLGVAVTPHGVLATLMASRRIIDLLQIDDPPGLAMGCNVDKITCSLCGAAGARPQPCPHGQDNDHE